MLLSKHIIKSMSGKPKYWQLCTVLLLVCIVPPVAMAQQEPLNVPNALTTYTATSVQDARSLLLWTDTLYHTIPAGDVTDKMVLWCTDDILLYSMNIYVGGTSQYVIQQDTIRHNGQVVEHRGTIGQDNLRLEIIRGSTISLGPFPITLSEPGSLMIPMEISSALGVQAVVDVTYVGGSSTKCHLDSFNPGMVGAPFPLGPDFDGFGGIMFQSTQVGLTDFNNYLKDSGEDWQLELAVRDTIQYTIPEVVDEMKLDGISLYLGPPDAANLRQIGEYGDDIVAISCCGTFSSLNLDDNLFRTAPPDSYLGTELARVLSYNGIEVILPIWTDDIWNNKYQGDISNAFEKLGGTVADGIMQDAGEKLSDLAPVIQDRIMTLSESYGADAVAVVSLPTYNIDLLRTMSEYPGAETVRWVGTDFVALDSNIIQDPAAQAFATQTGFTSLQLEGVGPNLDNVRQQLTTLTGKTATHDMLASYESAWILGLAMQYTQSTDPQRLSEAIPYIAERYSGTLGVMRMDSNGDLIGGSLEVWSVHDGSWTLVGTMKKH